MRLKSVFSVLTRLRYEAGHKLVLGDRRYRARALIPNQLSLSFGYDQHLVPPLRRALSANSGAFIDIGANTGQTLLKVLATDPSRKYIGFEPQIGCSFFIDQFLRDNAIDHAQILCLALSDKNSMLPIYADGQYDVLASLVEESRSRYGYEAAMRLTPARVGDEVLAELDVRAPGIVKIDVEGAELSVLRGLDRTMREARPICFFEVLPNFTSMERKLLDAETCERNRVEAKDLMLLFANLRYSVQQIDLDGAEHPITSFDLDSPLSYRGSDYVAYPIL